MVEVGRRVQERNVDGVGCVRWVGNLPGREGTWVGIEWDAGTRGTAKGEHEGEQMFECAGEDSSASFLPLDQVDTGSSFRFAVQNKYGAPSAPEEKEAFVLTETDQKVGIEFVGEAMATMAMSDVSQLRTISLHKERLAACPSTEAGEGAAAVCPRVDHLDLSDNLLTSWDVVEEITVGAKRLKCLNMAGNRLLPLASPPSRLPTTLRVLVLQRMQLDWQQVVTVQEHLGGSLKELHLSFNQISLREAEPVVWPALELLTMDSNRVECWSSVSRVLGGLPKLKKLILSLNPLAKIRYEAESFLTLTALSMENTKVDDWQSIDELNHFPCLTEVRTKGMPVLDIMSPTTQRCVTIARVQALAVLNGGKVLPAEREDSEKYFLHLCHRHVLAVAAGETGVPECPNITAEHPRYKHLIERYGVPQPASAKKATHQTLASDIAVVTVTLGMQVVTTQRVVTSMTVASLKMVLSHMLDLPAADQLVYYKRSNAALGRGELLDDDDRSLAYYGVGTGGYVNVEEA